MFKIIESLFLDPKTLRLPYIPGNQENKTRNQLRWLRLFSTPGCPDIPKYPKNKSTKRFEMFKIIENLFLDPRTLRLHYILENQDNKTRNQLRWLRVFSTPGCPDVPKYPKTESTKRVEMLKIIEGLFLYTRTFRLHCNPSLVCFCDCALACLLVCVFMFLSGGHFLIHWEYFLSLERGLPPPLVIRKFV
jgi:hypothetical protein